jgi:methionine-rich copper-binding protein CopC
MVTKGEKEVNQSLRIVAALMFAIGTAFIAQAHTTVRSSNPASGSVLTKSPPLFEIVFAERVRLTSLDLVNSKGEKNLVFTPASSGMKYTSAQPAFAIGRNEIRWTALAKDGHVIKGNIIIVMRPPRK